MSELGTKRYTEFVDRVPQMLRQMKEEDKKRNDLLEQLCEAVCALTDAVVNNPAHTVSGIR